MQSQNSECRIEHGKDCPYMKKPCEEVDHEICLAIVDAYDDGFHKGWMEAFPEE